MLLLLAALGVVVLAACTSGRPSRPPPPTHRATRSAAVSELRARLAEVASAQAEADRQLAGSVTAVREIDHVTSRLRDPATVDSTEDAWQRATAAYQGTDAAALHDGAQRLRRAVEAARGALSRLQAAVTSDWEGAYLHAQEAVLVELGGYADAADELAQVLGRHWPTYVELHCRTATFAEQRWLYRDRQEAADAYELAVSPLLERLAAAQAAIRAAREAHEAAAIDVNAATDAAAEVWRRRPSGAATGAT
ncbi:MAG TPA: hypothetical protein VHF25_10575 [Nitriliruptorales bacterium]|nr:hypothetical protein [Nitriliruptorales bacterium]